MFRLNLYQEAEAKRRARAMRLVATAAATAITGVILILTVFHAVGGLLLAERERAYERQKQERELEIASERTPGESARLRALQTRLREKTSRVEWSVKLAELARLIPGSLVLDQVEFSRRAKGRAEPSLIVNGSVLWSRGRDPVREVTNYVDSLRGSPLFSTGLRRIDIVSVVEDDATGTTMFRIDCPLGAEGES